MRPFILNSIMSYGVFNLEFMWLIDCKNYNPIKLLNYLNRIYSFKTNNFSEIYFYLIYLNENNITYESDDCLKIKNRVYKKSNMLSYSDIRYQNLFKIDCIDFIDEELFNILKEIWDMEILDFCTFKKEHILRNIL